MNIVNMFGIKGIEKENIVGDLDREINNTSTLLTSKKNKLVFCISGKEDLLKLTHECIVIISKDIDLTMIPKDNTYILTTNPRLVFARTIELLYTKYLDSTETKSVIDKSATVHKTSYIGPNCNIGKNVLIHPNVTILLNTTILENTVIFPNTVIGADGFGYERNEKNEIEKFPHNGGVHIGKNVEIGANTCIDRGVLFDTEIGDGTKIDNLVHVAHNIKIGKHCEIIANSMLGGSVTIGDYTRLAPSSCIRDGVSIGSNVLVGLGAVVTKDIPDGWVVAGNPARKIDELKKYLHFIQDNIGKL